MTELVLDPAAFDEARGMDRVRLYSPGGVYRFTNSAGHGSKIMVSGLCAVIVSTWPGPLHAEHLLTKSADVRLLRLLNRLDHARAYYVQLRDALPLCGHDVDDAVDALAILAEVQAADEFKHRMTTTCTWASDSDDPHVANYMTGAGATCADCAIACIKGGGRRYLSAGLPTLPEIHALKILRTAEKAAFDRAAAAAAALAGV